jgi:hypothetical protein
MIDLGLYFMGHPELEYVLPQTFTDFINNKSFKGPWGIPDEKDGITDIETAYHCFVCFKTGQIMHCTTHGLK